MTERDLQLPVDSDKCRSIVVKYVLTDRSRNKMASKVIIIIVSFLPNKSFSSSQ